MRPIDADKIHYVEAVKDTLEPSGEFYARREDIRAMPTIKPELHWIPCSERLPEEKDAGRMRKRTEEQIRAYVDGYNDCFKQFCECLKSRKSVLDSVRKMRICKELVARVVEERREK